MTEKLEPCPFCGTDARAVENPLAGWIMAQHEKTCPLYHRHRASSQLYNTKAEAIAAWNNRSNQPAGVERLPADVRRLVIAARRMIEADSAEDRELMAELDQAAEAFASRVPWENEDEG